jgi:TRAP-type transport system small permease protein
MRLLRILARWIDLASAVSNYIAMLSMAVMSFLILVEIVVRRFFGTSTLISEEWSSYLLAYVIFFGLANAFKMNMFIQVEIVFGALPKRVQSALRTFSIFSALLFVIIFDYYLITFVLSSYHKHLRSISFSETPMVIPQIAMPIGITLLGLQLLKTGLLRLVPSKAE